MGCGESKIKEINLAPSPQDSLPKKINGVGAISGGVQQNEIDGMMPNRLLSAIPISDLGDSLDSRHLGESVNAKSSAENESINNDRSANSADSGYGCIEYEEDYAHIITEHSSPELVKEIESQFQTVSLPELLVITGRACARILSGYQKNKLEEAKILNSLRDEGLLAKPKGKTAGGLSFEVVDASVIESKRDVLSESNSGAMLGDAFISAQFIPRKKLERLENRRVTIKRQPSANIEARLALAEERRKAQEEEKVKSVLERSGLERHGRMRTASARRRENKYTATVAKRQAQLQEMRDKLKEKHKKNDMVRLKHQLMNDNMQVDPKNPGIEDTGFFDD